MKQWQAALLLEATALMIALVMPVTPSRTGTEWSLAELVFPEPSYVQEVVVYFAAANLVMLLVGAVYLGRTRLRANGDEP